MTGESEKGDPSINGWGWVVWITGLSGSGKTVIAESLFNRLRQRSDNVIWLDGDELREVFGQDLGYSWEDRLKCATRYVRLCRLLSAQGHHVVISTVSMFHTLREWNRKNCPRYFEVYLRASPATLERRGISRRLPVEIAGTERLIVGKDLPFDEPNQADLILDTDEPMTPLLAMEKIWSHMQENFPPKNTGIRT